MYSVSRQRVLQHLGYNLGPRGVDGIWGDNSQRALEKFQVDCGAVKIPHWTTFTCWDVHKALRARGETAGDVQ
jgi:hypothetical protein